MTFAHCERAARLRWPLFEASRTLHDVPDPGISGPAENRDNLSEEKGGLLKGLRCYFRQAATSLNSIYGLFVHPAGVAFTSMGDAQWSKALVVGIWIPKTGPWQDAWYVSSLLLALRCIRSSVQPVLRLKLLCHGLSFRRRDIWSLVLTQPSVGLMASAVPLRGRKGKFSFIILNGSHAGDLSKRAESRASEINLWLAGAIWLIGPFLLLCGICSNSRSRCSVALINFAQNPAGGLFRSPLQRLEMLRLLDEIIHGQILALN